jgi:hypothetical protein
VPKPANPNIIIPLDPREDGARTQRIPRVVHCPHCGKSTPGADLTCLHCHRPWVAGYKRCPICRQPTNAHKLDCPIRPCVTCGRLRCEHVWGEPVGGEPLLLCPGQILRTEWDHDVRLTR